MKNKQNYSLTGVRFFLWLAAVLVIFTLFSGSAQCQQFPKEKSITFVCPTSAGGGMDRYSRLLVIYFKKYLPSNPNIVVRNIPGGDFAVGINAVVNADPDGYTLGLFLLPGNVLNQVRGLAKYDLSKVTWLGNVTSAPHLIVVRSDSPYRSLKDLQKAQKTLVVPVPGFQSVTGTGAVIASEVLGIKSKFIPHRGSTETILALLRGDADYLSVTYVAVRSQLQSKEIRPLLVYSDEKLKALPGVPTIKELGYGQLTPLEVAYFSVGTTPGVTAEVATIWRTAFEKTLKDVEFVKALEKMGAEAHYMSPGEVGHLVDVGIESYTKYKDLLEKYIGK
jgi:putative tricarboxylic transport membrane protein